VTRQAMTILTTMRQKAVTSPIEDERTKVVRSPLKGADDHQEVGLGMGMMTMEMMVTVNPMTVTASLSDE
jgi:hypothetical protein